MQSVLVGKVKWYDVQRGFGFVTVDGGDTDVMVHASVVKSHGHGQLFEGQEVSLEATRTDRGFQAARLLTVSEAPAEALPEPVPPLDPALRDALQPGRVKWFDRVKGFGFVNIFGSDEDVFVHMEVARAGGMSEIAQGDAVAVIVEQGPKGRIVSVIREWADANG
ncbi:MAG: cold-shock protein [Rubricella sp.]